MLVQSLRHWLSHQLCKVTSDELWQETLKLDLVRSPLLVKGCEDPRQSLCCTKLVIYVS